MSAAFFAALALATSVYVAAPWSLFGGASVEKLGAGLNPWAVQLATDYNVTNDDCFGGSPRFQLNIDNDGDGESEMGMCLFTLARSHPLPDVQQVGNRQAI